MKILAALALVFLFASHAQAEDQRIPEPCTDAAMKACWGTGWDGSWVQLEDQCFCDKHVKTPPAFTLASSRKSIPLVLVDDECPSHDGSTGSGGFCCFNADCQSGQCDSFGDSSGGGSCHN